jgi:hypothetical protein
VRLIEKRFPPNSQITADYLQMKQQDNAGDAETWKSCMIRFIKVLNIARRAQAKVIKYGNPAAMYSYPLNAPRYKTVAQNKKPSPPPQSLYSHGTDVKREVILESNRVCRNCGRDHISRDCPYIGCPGTNRDHDVEWPDSKAGKSWAFWNYKQFQIDRVLPGTEALPGLPLRDPKAREEEEYRAKRARYGDDLDDDTPAIDRRGKADKSPEDRSRVRNKPPLSDRNRQSDRSRPRYREPSRPRERSSARDKGSDRGHTSARDRGYDRERSRPRDRSSARDRSPKRSKPMSSAVVAAIAPRVDRVVASKTVLKPPTSFEMPPIQPLYVDNVDHILTTDDCLPITVFACKPKGCQDRSVLQTAEVISMALLDTGAVAGDFISEKLMIRLGASAHIYKTDEPITVCSGLNGDCFVSTAVIDLGITFLCKDNKTHTIFSTFRINPESDVDCIIGRASLRKYKFNILTPFALGFAPEPVPPTYGLLLRPPPVHNDDKPCQPKAYDRKTGQTKRGQLLMTAEAPQLPATSEPAPPDNKKKYEKRAASQRRKAAKYKEKQEALKLASYGPQEIPLGAEPQVIAEPTAVALVIPAAPPPVTNCPALGAHPTPGADSGQGQPGSRRLLACVIAAIVTRKDDTPRPGDDLNHTLPAQAMITEDPALDTVCDKPSGICISNDEIDSEKTDAFGPFLSGERTMDQGPENKFAYLKEITFEGTPSMQAKCRAVCAEFPEIFSDVLADEPADLDPFEFPARLPDWQQRKNQGPLRKNPPKKEVALIENITEMIKRKVVEK